MTKLRNFGGVLPPLKGWKHTLRKTNSLPLRSGGFCCWITFEFHPFSGVSTRWLRFPERVSIQMAGESQDFSTWKAKHIKLNQPLFIYIANWFSKWCQSHMKWKSKKIRTSFVICEECYSRRWLSQPTHLKKICPSKWEASPRFVLKIKHDLKPPPSTSWTFHIWGLVLGEHSFFGVGLDMQPEVVDGSTSVFVSWQKHIQHILLN